MAAQTTYSFSSDIEQFLPFLCLLIDNDNLPKTIFVAQASTCYRLDLSAACSLLQLFAFTAAKRYRLINSTASKLSPDSAFWLIVFSCKQSANPQSSAIHQRKRQISSFFQLKKKENNRKANWKTYLRVILTSFCKLLFAKMYSFYELFNFKKHCADI